MSAKFSTHILDRALARQRERREQRRQELLAEALRALDELSQHVPFEHAYIFGSLTQQGHFHEDSDVDVAFVGLRHEDFFRVLAWLSRKLDTDVDIVQLEEHPLREKILREGIPWTKSSCGHERTDSPDETRRL